MRDFNQVHLKGIQTALKIPSGGSDNTSSQPSKFGPGSKAKGAAKTDFARRQTTNKPTSGKSSGSIFAQGFIPQRQYGSRPMPQPGNFNIPKAPSGRCSAKLDDIKNQPKSKSPTSLKVERPTSMPHQDFVNLTKEERRQLPHSKDMKISHDGHPELTVGYWQAKYKLRDHGAVHGLSYTVKDNGGTQTEKTENNLWKFIGSIVDIPNRPNVKWFDHGTYQGGTNRGFDAVHIYDLDNQIIAVFRKDTGRFVTSCQLDRDEHIELLETGNFGGGTRWFSGQIRNLPPVTPKNSFESDIKGLTPIDNP